MLLYSYWRSSAAYRVRIALNLKNIEHEIVPVSLVGNSPEHRADAYRAINPQMLVPFLEDGSVKIGQSLAILEYLEESYPTVPLLPEDVELRAAVRSFCNSICSDIHPLNNLRVLQYLTDKLEVSDAQKRAWYGHWVEAGFEAAEHAASLYSASGEFVFGDKPTLADLCLVPQMYNARRFQVPLDRYPTLVSITDACNRVTAFETAAPEQQPDAKP